MTQNANPPDGGNLAESLHSLLSEQDVTGSLPSSELLVQCMTGPNWAPFMSVSDILACLALSRSCLYDQMDEGLLPPFVKFGARKANWPLVVLQALIQNRIEVREGMTHLRQRIQLPHWSTWCPHLPPTERDSGLDDLQSLQLLRVEEVADRLGVSVSTVYRFVRRRGLPGPLPVTTRARRWIAWEVTRWMNSCVAVSLRISGELPPRASRRTDRRSVPEDRPQR